MLKKIKNLIHINQEKNEPSVYEKIDNMFNSLSEDIIILNIGSDLIKFNKVIIDIISRLREEIKEECGFIMPLIRIKDNGVFQENEFAIFVHDNKVFNGFVIPTENGIRDELYEGLKTVVYDNLDRIFSNEITEKYINTVQKNNSWLIWNLTNILSVIDIKTILSDIIQRGKSINDINYIFEMIGEHILSESGQNFVFKQYNPHTIAKKVAEKLQ